jgi:DNA-binding response OmpR family regulator
MSDLRQPPPKNPAAVPDADGGRDNGGAEPYVLVVEDDPVINELVGAYARLAGLGYRGAMTGDAAFQELRQRRPAMIVLDVMLPDLDGFEICRRIKSQPDTAPVPVVMLTALHDDEYRERGLACGASEYLTKPFDPDQLIEAMTRYGKGGEGVRG